MAKMVPRALSQVPGLILKFKTEFFKSDGGDKLGFGLKLENQSNKRKIAPKLHHFRHI